MRGCSLASWLTLGLFTSRPLAVIENQMLWRGAVGHDVVVAGRWPSVAGAQLAHGGLGLEVLVVGFEGYAAGGRGSRRRR